jgi:hypothetical protein
MCQRPMKFSTIRKSRHSKRSLRLCSRSTLKLRTRSKNLHLRSRSLEDSDKSSPILKPFTTIRRSSMMPWFRTWIKRRTSWKRKSSNFLTSIREKRLSSTTITFRMKSMKPSLRGLGTRLSSLTHPTRGSAMSSRATQTSSMLR